ncbi:uncharacterized protein LJ206_006196 isoform 2-T2 [Theristicus caerulescens]
MKMYTFNFMLFQTKLNLFFYYSEISSLKLDADSARSNTFQQTADENRRRNRWRHHPVLAPNNALELYMVHKASPCGEADSTPAKSRSSGPDFFFSLKYSDWALSGVKANILKVCRW